MGVRGLFRSARPVAIGALAGSIAGALCLTVLYASRPDLELEFDRDLPGFTEGVHPVERDGPRTVAWTSEQATVSLPGLDRRVPWECSVALRGLRPVGVPPPGIALAADGISLATVVGTNNYESVDIVVPASRRDGLTLAISSAPTMVRGPRVLGIQIDRLRCRPSAGALVHAPHRAILAGSTAAGVLGAALGVIGMPVWGAALGATVVAIAQAHLASSGPAPYTAYPTTLSRAAIWIAVVLALISLLRRWRTQQPLHGAARFVIAFSAVMLYLDLAGLFHPTKLVVDALFHANRLEWVLDGRYYFTQPMPSGVRFPYAIALYLFAAPWSHLTTDYVSLLRIIVCAAWVLACALLYPLVVRAWGDRLAGALAVALAHTAPVPYLTLGYANLTFAFGQAVALATLAAAASWPFPARNWLCGAGLFALAFSAFLSHVGIFPVLFVTLVATALLYWWWGEPPLANTARALLLLTTLAAVSSVATYYGHFTEAYETLERVRARASGAMGAPQASSEDAGPSALPRAPAVPKPVYERLAGGLARSARAVGWPLVLLALVGTGQLVREGVRDRLALMLGGGAFAYVAFFGFTSVVPVEPRFLRYNDEFIDRLSYLTLPIAAILAARGAAWAWRARGVLRFVALALVAIAGFIGSRQWLEWLR